MTAAVLQFIISTGGAAIIVGIVNALVNRAKNKADTNNTKVQTDQTIFQMQRDHIADVESRLDKYEARLKKLEDENTQLTDTVRYLQGLSTEQETWIQKVYGILSAEQKAHVGTPPKKAPVPVYEVHVERVPGVENTDWNVRQ